MHLFEIKNEVGSSVYQIESKKYYDLFRDIHAKIFSFNPTRIKAEKEKERYLKGNVKGIRNLYTFVTFLKKIMANKTKITGIDYGCGDHFFVDDVRKQFGWDIIGYDADENAIKNAQLKYPDSADRYICLDLLKNKIPQLDQSQDFVFCNAVIQHFSTDELWFAFQEIWRVLKRDGIFVLIFKRNIEDWEKYSKEMKLKVEIINEKEGMIKIEDEPMKNAIQKLNDNTKSKLENDYLKGLRLFHFFNIDEILTFAHQKGLEVLKDIEFEGTKLEKTIFKYQSGKRIPTAAIFFEKFLIFENSEEYEYVWKRNIDRFSHWINY